MITAQVLKELPSQDLHYVSGPLTQVASCVLPPESCNSESLVFVGKQSLLDLALKANASIIVAHKSLLAPAEYKGAFFSVASIQMGMAIVLPLFDGKMNRFNQAEKIHPTAVVHPTAHLEKGVCLGPYVVIGEKAFVGESCTIGSHTVIENEVRVGAHTLLHPHVFVGSHCEIGAHCEIHPHTTIGADGFSFVTAPDGSHRKIPQIGKVVIGDHVEIGANCTIDRAALTMTSIGRGTKMDNLCHIAHNCSIGEHCVIAAGFRIAGSSSLGSYCMVGGETAISDHSHITDKVILGGRSGVVGDITKPGAYGGYPIEPLKDAMKTLVNLTHLTRMRKEMNRILKHLDLKQED